MEGGGRFEGRVCVVAGAKGDMGEAIVERFAREGDIVVGIDRQPQAIGALPLIADLTDEAAVAQAYARIVADFGRIGVLYNNAGSIAPKDHLALDTPLVTSASGRNRLRAASLICQ